MEETFPFSIVYTAEAKVWLQFICFKEYNHIQFKVIFIIAIISNNFICTDLKSATPNV